MAVPSGHDGHGRHGVVALVLAAVLCASGCSRGSDENTAAGPSSSPSATAPATPAGSSAPVTTDPAGLPIPATTAGNLNARSVPGPPAIGKGWKRYVDPGDVDEGYAGNGSWVRARGPAEVVQSVVPLGCAGLTEPPRLPVPRNALEATYRGPAGQPAVALVLEYPGTAQAKAFLAGMAAIARACSRRPAQLTAQSPLTSVVTPVRIAGSVVLDRRREYGVGASEFVWSEIVVREGSRIGLLTLAGPRTGGPDLVALSAQVRRSVVR